MDLIVCPEYCDIPAASSNKQEADACAEKYNQIILEKAKEYLRMGIDTVLTNDYQRGSQACR